MREFTQTDLPEPVAPAMRRWGRLHEVDELGLASDVLAEDDGYLHLRGLEGLVIDDLAEGDYGTPLVGHLDAHRVLARDGRDDADARGGEPQGDVVREVGDLGEADAGGGEDLEHRYNWSLSDAGDLGLDVELREGLLEDLRRLPRLVVDDPVLTVGIGVEEAVHRDGIGLGLAPREDAQGGGGPGRLGRSRLG